MKEHEARELAERIPLEMSSVLAEAMPASHVKNGKVRKSKNIWTVRAVYRPRQLVHVLLIDKQWPSIKDAWSVFAIEPSIRCAWCNRTVDARCTRAVQVREKGFVVGSESVCNCCLEPV